MAHPMLDLWKTSLQFGMMAAEANAVITMRLWGMGGAWSVTPHENTRMYTEKLEALSKAAMLGGFAAMSGKRPDQIMAASLKPVRQKTRANSKRLAKRGPKLI